MRLLFFIILPFSMAILSSSCRVISDPVPPRKADRVMHRWYDDGGSGAVGIRISLTDQIAEFTRGNRKIGWSYVATGREGFGTKPGQYKITEKIVDKHSNRYGWMEDPEGNMVIKDAKHTDRVPPGLTYVPAPMPYWMRLTSYGIGMHAGIIPEPGEPASHGCIRLPKDFVPILYDSVKVGTPVVITRSPATQGPHIPRVSPQPADQPPAEGRVISSRPLTPDEASQMRSRTREQNFASDAGYGY